MEGHRVLPRQKVAAAGLGIALLAGAGYVGQQALETPPAPQPSVRPAAAMPLAGSAVAGASGRRAARQSGPVSINSASAIELEALPAVGPVIARRIVEYRSAHGPFRSVDELIEVKGIGPKTLEKIRPYAKL